MNDLSDIPPAADAAAIDRFSDAIYELLQVRAQSIGVLDIGIEIDDWFIDGELMFVNGPDMGFSIDSQARGARFCELLDDDGERWLDDVVEVDFLDLAPGDMDALAEQALIVLNGVLDARRPLLRANTDGGDEWR
jgi:hypothetical protein